MRLLVSIVSRSSITTELIESINLLSIDKELKALNN